MGAETGARIVEYARSKRRTQVGSGECFDLAVEALRSAGQKTAYEFGEVTRTADYTWGTETPLSAVQAGDILQYRDYKMVKKQAIRTTYSLPDGRTLTVDETSEESLDRPHHTAIATGAPVNGALGVLEQNVERVRGRGPEKRVDDGEIYVAAAKGEPTTRSEKVRIDIAWGQKLKRLVGPRNAAAIDAIVKKNLGKSADAEITTTETITVTGKLTAYRPQPR